MQTNGCLGIDKLGGLLLAIMIVMAIITVAVAAETKPYYAIKDSMFSKSGIRVNEGITEFEIFFRIKNMHNDSWAKMPATSFTIYFDGENIGSGTLTGVSIPPGGTVPFPVRWEIPDSINAGKLFAIQKGGKEVRFEGVMHAPIFNTIIDIPITVIFGENKSIVS